MHMSYSGPYDSIGTIFTAAAWRLSCCNFHADRVSTQPLTLRTMGHIKFSAWQRAFMQTGTLKSREKECMESEGFKMCFWL